MTAAKHLSLAAFLLCSSTAVSLAADIIVTRTLVHTGMVDRVEADGIVFKLRGLGEIKIYKADILRYEIDKPAQYEAALRALNTRSFRDAAAELESIVDRYAGLDVSWVQDAMLQLGEVYIELNDFDGAKRTFDAFGRLYPQSPQAAGLGAKHAKVLVEQKDYAKAADALENFAGPLLKKEFLTDQQEIALAEALVLLGDCRRATKLPEKALDSYLLVVTLFDSDANRTAEARYKAAQTFEDLANWKRAKSTYEELLKESPAAAFAADAQNRLSALVKNHPE